MLILPPILSDSSLDPDPDILKGIQPRIPQSSLGGILAPGRAIPDELLPLAKASAGPGGLLGAAEGSHQLGKQIFNLEKPPDATAPIGSKDYLQQRGTQLEYEKEHPWGSAISAHPGVAGKIFHGLAKAGNIAGDILAPGTMALIPGTDLNKSLAEKSDIAGAERAGQLENQTTEAGAQKERADTEKELAENPKPKEPTNDFELWAKQNPSAPASDWLKLQEQNKTQPKPEKPDTPEQQFIDEYQKAHPEGKVADAIAAYANATQKPEKEQRQLAVINGKVVELKPGMDATGAQSIGGEEKANVAGKAGEDALNYAKDYMKGGKFTGPGDEALMEKYFELAKPSSGFRMTQAQIEMLQKARDLMGGFEAKAKHLFTPEAPYFSDTQRKQITETMSALENSRNEPTSDFFSKFGGKAKTH